MGASAAACCLSREDEPPGDRLELRRLREDLVLTRAQLLELSHRILGKLHGLSDRESEPSWHQRCSLCHQGTASAPELGARLPPSALSQASATAPTRRSCGNDSGDSEGEVLITEEDSEYADVGRGKTRIIRRKVSTTLFDKVAQLQTARSAERGARPALPRLDLARAQAMPTLLARPASAGPAGAKADVEASCERRKAEAYDICTKCQHFRMHTISASRSSGYGSEGSEAGCLVEEEIHQRPSRGYRLSPRLQYSGHSSLAATETPRPEPDSEAMPPSVRNADTPHVYALSPRAKLPAEPAR